MKYGVMDFLSLIGSLGLFLFGMKIMSEALQKTAGSRMRQILATMTSTRFKGIMTGILITAIIQSSSATTVMIVSFVNAGLLSLVESIGVIMGANIGTTVTAWVISILGFNMKISVLSLPLIGIGFPFLFAKSNKTKYTGEFIIGFAFLFLGLEFLKESVPDINSHPDILAFLQNYTNMGIRSTLLFVLIGTILTVIIQSSSATMALTLVMCNNGWIPFEIAAAMVLGENLGTTITANLAAIVGNVSSKRAARAHFIFNIIGVLWMFALIPVFLRIITSIMSSTSLGSPLEHVGSIPIALSIFHSSFNLLNTLFLVGFTRAIEKTVTWMVPQKEDDEEFRLKYISFGLLTTSEMSILQAKSEINLYSYRVTRMFGYFRSMFDASSAKDRENYREKVIKYESISDNIEVEIASYLTNILENRDITGISSKRIRSMYKIIDEIESIADSCYHMMETLDRKYDANKTFTSEQRNNINHMFDLLDKALEVLNENLEAGYKHISLDKAQAIEDEINDFRTRLKIDHLKNIEKKKYSYLSGIYYNDIISEAEVMGDHIINISESIYEILHPLTT